MHFLALRASVKRNVILPPQIAALQAQLQALRDMAGVRIKPVLTTTK